MLEWNVSGCVAFAELLEGEEAVITESLAVFSMIAGVGWSITEENAGEWFARVSFYETLYGPLRYRPSEDGEGFDYVRMTLRDIRARIGFWSNGMTKKETRKQWTARVAGGFMLEKEKEYKGFSSYMP
jgi:hypothetical protein